MEATRIGSAGSTVPGQPVFTLQYEQARVQVSPRIMNVAVPRSQHSPMFGQAASSQTVFRLAPLIFLRISRKLSPPGAFTLNQSGSRRSTVGEPVFSDFETNEFRSFQVDPIIHHSAAVRCAVSAIGDASALELVQNNRQGHFFIDLFSNECTLQAVTRQQLANGKT